MRINIDNWEEYKQADEPTGQQEKVWLINDNKLWLFKKRSNRKEDGTPILSDVCECVASDIIDLLGVDHAKYFLCERNGIKGVITPNFLNNEPYALKREEFISGIQLLYKVDPGFKNKGLENPKTKQLYTVSLILESIEEFGCIKKALEWIIISLLIANSDCNPSNYGIIKNLDTKETRFAPIFDNSASLAITIGNNRIHREVIEVDGKPIVIDNNHFQEVIHHHMISSIVLEKHFQRPEQKLWYKIREEQGLPNVAYNFRIMEYQPMIEYMTRFYPEEINDIMNKIQTNITPSNIDTILDKYNGELDMPRREFARSTVLQRAEWMTAFYNKENEFSEGEMVR